MKNSGKGNPFVLFGHALSGLLNQYGIDNELDTPDFILSKYIVQMLKILKKETKSRKLWFKARTIVVQRKPSVRGVK